MLSADSVQRLQVELASLVEDQRQDLDRLRTHARQLRGSLERIQPRPATSVSLVGTDGGNNKVEYDPLMVDLVRIVDSSSNEYHIEAVTPNLTRDQLDGRQFNADGSAKTKLGSLMNYLGVRSLKDLCQVFKVPDNQRSASWIGEYRGLHEWAVLFHLVRDKDFGTDTIIVRDGPFREKMFLPGMFSRVQLGLQEGLDHQLRSRRRRLYLVGVLKKSKIFQRYRLAMALERTFYAQYPCFAKIPENMLLEAFGKWPEWIKNSPGSAEGFVAGQMFAAKFGSGPYDPVWLVDIFDSQAVEAHKIMSFLLNDAVGGFPVPCYPASLQRAHDAAALVNFDMDVIEHMVASHLRISLASDGEIVDKLALQEMDPSAARYG
jgi:hypothetical protein